jgi:hypothetical protein
MYHIVEESQFLSSHRYLFFTLDFRVPFATIMIHQNIILIRIFIVPRERTIALSTVSSFGYLAGLSVEFSHVNRPSKYHEVDECLIRFLIM